MALRRLTVHPIDVHGDPVPVDAVHLRVDGVDARPDAGVRGAVSFAVPSGARVAVLEVESAIHWPVQQVYDLDRGPARVSTRGGRLYRPTVDVQGPIDLGGTDEEVRFKVVMSALRNVYEDASALAALGVAATPVHVSQYTWPRFTVRLRNRREVVRGRARLVPASDPPRTFDFRPGRSVMPLLGDPVLGAGLPAPGWDRLNLRRTVPVTPAGRLYFLQRRGRRPPFMVAVYSPLGTASGLDGGYHVFLHPFITAQMTDPRDDPYAYEYVARAYAYLYNFGLIHRAWAAARRCALVFPIGLQAAQFGDLLSHSAMRRMLEEINFFLHSAGGGTWVGYRQAPVARVAVSGYSFGVNWIQALLSRPGPGPGRYGRRFYDDLLREVYWFDGMPPSFGPHLGALLGWYRSGQGDRRLRIYTSNGFKGATDTSWRPLRQLLRGRPTVRRFENRAHRGRAGSCVEIESERPHGTLVTLPALFWDGIVTEPPRPLPLRDAAHPARGRQSVGEHYFWGGHGLFPSLMHSHALLRSGFSRA